MMFLKRKRQDNPAKDHKSAVSENPAAEITLLETTLDKVLDTLNAVVRMLGRHAFDTSERSSAQFRDDCERWSRHILIGADKPDDSRTESPTDAQGGPASAGAQSRPASAATPLAKRDWNGLYHFLQQQRVSEEQAVVSTTGALRNLVFESLNSFRQVLEEDQEFSGELGVALERLEQSAENQPLEVMRAQILQTAQSMSGMIKAKSRAVDEQLERIRAQIKATRQEILDMRRELEEDAVTGTFNRRALDLALTKMANYVSFVQEDLAILLIDIDNLKEVEQADGPEAMDALLHGVGQTLIKAFPRRDDLITRFDDNMFAVVLTRTNQDAANRLANRCVNLFRELEVPWQGDTLSCTVSVGFAIFAPPEDIGNCLTRAQQALHQAQQAGRNRHAGASS